MSHGTDPPLGPTIVMRRSDWLPLALLAAVAAHFVLVVIRLERTDGAIASDLYRYYYPNMLYALQSWRDGGRGWWWNSLLGLGQPFFANTFTGTLYPANLAWLLLAPASALRAVIGFNLLVAGVSAYALCRTLGLGTVAALCGALTFQLGNATVGFLMWGPQTSGAYVWMPAALLGCERILRKPTFGGAVFLGTVLAISLLPGMPQVVFFAYQLIALRVVWELVSSRMTRPLRTLGYLALGLILPPLLIAVQFIPGLEVADLSVRHRTLHIGELAPEGFMDWSDFRRFVSSRRHAANPLLLVPCIIACAALLRPFARRVALFYLAAGLLYFALAFGPHTPLFGLYVQLPLGRLFRDPIRFMWVPGLCLAVVTAAGVDALTARTGVRLGPWARAISVALAAAAALGFHLLLPSGFQPSEWLLAAAAVAAMAIATLSPARRWMPVLVLGVLLANLLWVHRTTLNRLLPDDRLLYAHRDLFEQLIIPRMTPQDRVFLVPGSDYELIAKTASLFGVPAVDDYEPSPTQRYADYFVLLRSGRRMTSLTEFYRPGQARMKRRLFDLAATRYLIAGRETDLFAKVTGPALTPVARHPTISVYENPQALPRAFYVPRVELVADPNALLQRLADGDDDLRQVALVEEAPPSAFLGAVSITPNGKVAFVRDDPERLVLSVDAPARGFLFLADQYFPGWSATVNGAPAPILRANYLFRLVEVPQGKSLVDFHYAPGSLRLGALVSALTIAGVGITLLLRRIY